METQNWRGYKETETRSKIADKRLWRGIGIKEETKMKKLLEKYRFKKKRLKTVMEELNQRMLEKIVKVKRYQSGKIPRKKDTKVESPRERQCLC